MEKRLLKMNRYKYIGKSNPAFDTEGWFTIEHAYPQWDTIKLCEVSYPITCEFFIANFDEITENDLFHEKLLNEVLDKKTTANT